VFLPFLIVLGLGAVGTFAVTQYHPVPQCTRGFEGVSFQVHAVGPRALGICSSISPSNQTAASKPFDVAAPDTSLDIICIRDITDNQGRTTRVIVRDSGFVPAEGDKYCGTLGGTAVNPKSP
jgi:hypothetical protein